MNTKDIAFLIRTKAFVDFSFDFSRFICAVYFWLSTGAQAMGS